MSMRDEHVFGGRAPLVGELVVPGDKSMSHRALLFAALADGRSRVTNLATGEDVAASRGAIEALGVRVRADAQTVTVNAAGRDALVEPDDVIDCGNSGTTMRIISGLLAGLEVLSVLTGDESLRRRPMGRVVDPLRALGADITGRSGGNLAPLVIGSASLVGGRIEIEVPSAQVRSALVLAALGARGDTEIVASSATRDHTERMLGAMNAPVVATPTGTRVSPGAPEPFEFETPGDPSSAAFFAVAASITPGSDITLTNVSLNPTRIGFVNVLQRMGAAIETSVTETRVGEPVGSMHVRHAPLVSTVIAGAEIPGVVDEIPILAMAAAVAEGVTEVRDAAELRLKESDRIGAIAQELTEVGLGVETWSDGLAIRGGTPRSAVLKSHGDHRMAMAGAVLAHALDEETTVRGWRCVTSSYPGFADDLASLVRA